LTESLFGYKIVFASPTIFLTGHIMRLTNHYLGVYPLTYITTNHRDPSSGAASDLRDRCPWREGGDDKK
jgi:hypothetical protein